MKHHFSDVLDRDGDHWTVVPNGERFAYQFHDIEEGDPNIEVATIGKTTPQWQKCLRLPRLAEVTLHEASVEQLEAICECTSIKRLRISHLRPMTIESLSKLVQLEELVLEYVSGFSDLSPLSRLPNLRSLHLENLRRVSDFHGLSGCSSLRYLSIFGTLDWNQPIDNFEFLRGLKKLEQLGFAFVTSARAYPAFLPAKALKSLKAIKLPSNYFATQEYALLSVILDGVTGANWGAYRRVGLQQMALPGNDPRRKLSADEIRKHHPEICITYKGRWEISDPAHEWFEFTGKRAGRVKCTHPESAKRCAEAEDRFEAMKIEARAMLDALSPADDVGM